MKYEVEKGIDIPEGRGHRPCKYPWRLLEVGDSFFVPISGDMGTPRNKLNAAASYFAKRNPEYAFTLRTLDGGVRVWRVLPETGGVSG